MTSLTSPAAAAPFPIFQPAPTPVRQWVPRRVMLTRDARQWPHGVAMAERAAALGAEVIELPANRLTGLTGDDERQTYARAKTSLAIVVSPPSKRRLQPIPPSADWQFHLAEGCPAHCQYCYLAGSLSGPPVTKAYANLPEILDALRPYAGQGTITSRSAGRAHEGTTFEASCYTDPLGIEHLTRSLAETVRFFGAWDAPVQLRWTTKFDGVDELLTVPHAGRTRARFSVNTASVARLYEGGTATLAARLRAMRRMARAGYPVGLTVAPIMPIPDWRDEYGALLRDAATALAGVPALDLTVELITHRFTPQSRDVLLGWYPRTTLEMDEAQRSRKRTKFGTEKYVYPSVVMADLRAFFERTIADHLPQARVLYWT